MKRAYKTFESWYHNLFVAEIVTRSYNFHRWTSKPAEKYSVNKKQTSKPPKLHTIMKKCNGTGLVLKICETKNNVWKRHGLSIQSSIDNYIGITKIKLDSASLNSAEVHRLFDMTGSLFDCLSYFKLY